MSFCYHFYGFWPTFYSCTDAMNRVTLVESLFPYLKQGKEGPIERANIIIASVFAPILPLAKYKKPSTKIILWTGESQVPDEQHRIVDLTIGSSKNGEKDVICPFGLVFYRTHAIKHSLPVPMIPFQQRKFAVFVCSNPKQPIRNNFYQALSKYRPVDGFGRMFQRPAPGHFWDYTFLQFLSQYRFVICFENARRPGYVTEKIINPILAGCIPIYWGADAVNQIVRPERYVRLLSPSSNDVTALIQRIQYIDTHEDEFMKVVSEHPWTKETIDQVDKQLGCQNAIQKQIALLSSQ